MKRKLELKDIAGYLPYGLMGIFRNMNEPVFYTTGIKSFNGRLEVTINEDTKPILRPLSDLYKTITHNGKEIVPIVELAKIAIGSNKTSFNTGDEVVCVEGFVFFYHKNGFNIRLVLGESEVSVHNQYQLFDYLNELKIDYRGLIDAGLAVSVYDLENNPYK